MPNKKLEELLKEWNEVKKDKNLREGQALMNALGNIDMESYRSITATDVDCFYDDDLIPEMLATYKVIKRR